MGGVGKTTLAQLVYNDEKVANRFDLKLWACVSDVFDVLGVTRTILMSRTSVSCDEGDLNMHQLELKELLSGKRFFLVLDDVWDHEYEEWDVLRRPFLAGAAGSRILVTTRSANVAKMMSRVQAHNLKQLGDDHCLSLLSWHAFERENFEEHLDLKETGEKIVKKCQGLPLAVKALGGSLRGKSHRNQWEAVLNSEMWELSTGVLPALQLSYHHLPSHLKRCFAFFAVFPKGYEFDDGRLVSLWMALGLLPPSNSRMRAENIGLEYITDLLSRSFIHEIRNKPHGYVMHDLIIDLAQLVAGKAYFKLDQKSQLSESARHLSYSMTLYDRFQRFANLKKTETFRTFLPLRNQWLRGPYSLSHKVLVDLLPKLKCLRALSLSCYDIIELSDSIGELKLLRYLDLSCTKIKRLPERVCSLYYLKTLALGGCEHLYMLPADFGNLVNLRCLHNPKTTELRAMPPGIDKFTNLFVLDQFIVNKNGGAKLRELKDLMHLHGKLTLLGLQDVMDSQDAAEANLRNKPTLISLELQWCYPWRGSSANSVAHNEELEADVLHSLEPHRNIQILRIERYGGLKFANWIGDPSFSELCNISFINCRSCTSLPPLGQLPKLKHLFISGMPQVRSVSVEFYRDDCSSEAPFTSLEALTFDNMPNWKEWSCCSGNEEVGLQFPRLLRLNITECPKLTKIQLLRLPSLSYLQLGGCHEVVLKSLICLTSLIELKIFEVTKLTCLLEEFLHFCVRLEVLLLRSCPQLLSLRENGVALQSLVSLKTLRINNCPQLMSLGEEEEGLLPNLENLFIEDCKNLQKLPIDLKSVKSLHSLVIQRCPNLECLRDTSGQLVSLKNLEIASCQKLVSFPAETSILPNLRRMVIKDCEAMESLPNYDADISLLQELEVENCSSLRWWPVGKSPPSLKRLMINCCKNMVPGMSSLFGSFESLVELHIRNCDGLELFPEVGWPFTPGLRMLRIWECKNLKFFCLDELQSLDHLDISKCPNLMLFPNGNLPPNLRTLLISGCGEQLKPLSEWGLHRLASLRVLNVNGGYPEMVSLSDKNSDDRPLLPPTVKTLDIRGLPNLVSISKCLENLTNSLERLILIDCPNLRYLAEEDLLANLSRLEIFKCPLLKKRCLPKGEYWPMIANIPLVIIDGRNIYELISSSQYH